MMRGRSLLVAACSLAMLLHAWPATVHAQRQPATATLPSAGDPRAVVNKYCITCHSTRLKTAGLVLDTLDLDKLPDDAEIWEKVVRKLRVGAMPPVGAPRPDAATSDALASWLETTLDHAAAARPDPGRPSLHRLNRAEYANAIRDLLAV